MESDDAAADVESPRVGRLEARLASLETRLGMLETSMQAEVERLNLSAGRLDSLAEELRSMVAGTSSVLGLVKEMGDRVESLQRIEAELSSVSEAVPRRAAEAVGEQLKRDLGGLGDAIERLAADLADLKADRRSSDRDGALRAGLDALEPRLDALAQAPATLGARIDQLATAVERWRRESFEDTIDPATVIDPLSQRLDALIDVVAELRTAHDATRSIDAAVEQVNAVVTEQGGVLSSVAADVAELRARPVAADPTATVDLAPVVEALHSGLTELRASLRDPTPAIDDLADAVTQVRAAVADPRPRLDAIAATLIELRAGQADLLPALSAMNSVLGDVRAHEAELRRTLDELPAAVPDPAPGLASVRTAIDELRLALPDHEPAFSGLAERLDGLDERLDERADGLDERIAQTINSVGERLTTELSDVRTLVLDLRAAVPEQREALVGLTERLHDIRAAVTDVQVAGPEQAAGIAALGDAIDNLRTRLDRRDADADETLAGVRHTLGALEALPALRQSLEEASDASRHTAEVAETVREAISQLYQVVTDRPDALALASVWVEKLGALVEHTVANLLRLETLMVGPQAANEEARAQTVALADDLRRELGAAAR